MCIPFANFIALVPAGNEKRATWQEAGLEYSQQRPADRHCRERLREAHTHEDDAERKA